METTPDSAAIFRNQQKNEPKVSRFRRAYTFCNVHLRRDHNYVSQDGSIQKKLLRNKRYNWVVNLCHKEVSTSRPSLQFQAVPGIPHRASRPRPFNDEKQQSFNISHHRIYVCWPEKLYNRLRRSCFVSVYSGHLHYEDGRFWRKMKWKSYKFQSM